MIGTYGRAWTMKRKQLPKGPRRQRGSAIVEYSIITMLVIVVLVANDNVVGQLMQAIKGMYEAFSYALSMTFPTDFLQN
ncbi:hypothetical protein [Marilutibacter alkalisoli]|uniref:Uncharacterized protein n=1 Tax=Marilutibacter alkalisoli TaxID=2591633 RepID=A0A514BW11_9GAMM|nr:hypothetical protein [Lysobacter alkalisoli]QDH71594.1 hypothetical protein FKV23_16950 [Lysobacter alkalisoli]